MVRTGGLVFRHPRLAGDIGHSTPRPCPRRPGGRSVPFPGRWRRTPAARPGPPDKERAVADDLWPLRRSALRKQMQGAGRNTRKLRGPQVLMCQPVRSSPRRRSPALTREIPTPPAHVPVSASTSARAATIAFTGHVWYVLRDQLGWSWQRPARLRSPQCISAETDP
jgi:hypothetical protein